MYITELSIRRPVVAWVLSLILIVFGLFVYSELPVRELPDGLQPPVGAGNCAACHTLSDAGSIAEIGPNLNQIRPQVQTILMSVRNGIGVMPAMEGILSDEEIEAVAHYVSISAEQ